jgi:hypothetical protein
MNSVTSISYLHSVQIETSDSRPIYYRSIYYVLLDITLAINLTLKEEDYSINLGIDVKIENFKGKTFGNVK